MVREGNLPPMVLRKLSLTSLEMDVAVTQVMMVVFLGLQHDCSWAPALAAHFKGCPQRVGSGSHPSSKIADCSPQKSHPCPGAQPSPPSTLPSSSHRLSLSETVPALLWSSASKVIMSIAGTSLCLFPSYTQWLQLVQLFVLLSDTKFSS